MDKIYKEMSIGLNGHMQFTITDHREGVPAEDRLEFGYTGYDTYRQACEAVDRKLKAAEAMSQKDLAKRPVISEAGETLTCRALHASRGTMLFTPPRPDVNEFWPAVNWIEALIKERVALDKRRLEIHKAINPYRISAGRYGYSPDDDLADRYAAIIKEIDDKAAKAQLATVDHKKLRDLAGGQPVTLVFQK